MPEFGLKSPSHRILLKHRSLFDPWRFIFLSVSLPLRAGSLVFLFVGGPYLSFYLQWDARFPAWPKPWDVFSFFDLSRKASNWSGLSRTTRIILRNFLDGDGPAASSCPPSPSIVLFFFPRALESLIQLSERYTFPGNFLPFPPLFLSRFGPLRMPRPLLDRTPVHRRFPRRLDVFLVPAHPPLVCLVFFVTSVLVIKDLTAFFWFFRFTLILRFRHFSNTSLRGRRLLTRLTDYFDGFSYSLPCPITSTVS